MKIKELREMTKDELSARRRELKMDLLNMRIQQASGQLENPSRFKILRKEIARIETIVSARALNLPVSQGTRKSSAPRVESAPVVEAAAKKPAKKATAKKTAAKKATKSKAAE